MILSEIENICNDYISQVRKTEQEMKPTDGLFGIGRKISDDSCHDAFADKLEKLLADYANTQPDSDEVSEVLEYIYAMPLKCRENDSVYWMLNAVHGLTCELISFLSAERAASILNSYKVNYPRSKRLPVHKQLIKLLEKRVKDKK